MSNPLSVLLAQTLQEDRIRDAQRTRTPQPRNALRSAGQPWWRRPRRSARGSTAPSPARGITA
jgi:hypothetical protein